MKKIGLIGLGILMLFAFATGCEEMGGGNKDEINVGGNYYQIDGEGNVISTINNNTYGVTNAPQEEATDN